MKFIFSILIFLLSNTAFTQVLELQGIYHGKNGEWITFVGNDSFYFEKRECKSVNYGKGKCRIVNDLLYLDFEKSENKIKKEQNISISKTTEKNIDSTTKINFIALDNTGMPIDFLTTKTEYEKEKIISITKESTCINIKTNKTTDTIKFTINGIGIKSMISKLESGFNYKIILYINKFETFDIEYNKGETFVYEFEEVSDEFILMRRKTFGEEFIKYRKFIKSLK